MLKQTATYWGPSTVDEYGDPSFAAPVEVTCRWENKVIAFFDSDGEEQHSRHIVYLDTPIENGGWLYLGASTASNPLTVDGADRIRQIFEWPDMKVKATLWKAVL